MDTNNQTSNNNQQPVEPVHNQVSQQPVQNPRPVNAMPAQNMLSQMPPVPIPARNNNAPPVYPPAGMNPYQPPMMDDNGKAKLYGIIAVIAIIAGIIGGLISGGIVSSANHIDSNVSRNDNNNDVGFIPLTVK